MVSKVVHAVFAAAFCVCAVLPVAAAAQESKSAPLAKQLAQVLDQAKLESIAAADPTTGAFVAALYIPGTQLLVVSGMFDAPAIGAERISRKEYRDLYMDLQGAAKAGTRVFAQDVSADGLLFKSQRRRGRCVGAARTRALAFDGWQESEDERGGLYEGVLESRRAVRAHPLAARCAQAKAEDGLALTTKLTSSQQVGRLAQR